MVWCSEMIRPLSSSAMKAPLDALLTHQATLPTLDDLLFLVVLLSLYILLISFWIPHLLEVFVILHLQSSQVLSVVIYPSK